MPIYEYKCPSCKHVFEEWVKGHDTEAPCTCPKCGADASHIVSNTTFVLKGGGWYVTEYGNRKPNGEGAASAPAPDHVEGGGESSAATAASGSDAAPAAATASDARPAGATPSGARPAGAAASDTKPASAAATPTHAPAASKAASAA